MSMLRVAVERNASNIFMCLLSLIVTCDGRWSSRGVAGNAVAACRMEEAMVLEVPVTSFCILCAVVPWVVVRYRVLPHSGHGREQGLPCTSHDGNVRQESVVEYWNTCLLQC